MNNKTFEPGLTIEELEMFFFGEEPVPEELMWKLDREYFNALYGNHNAIVDTDDYSIEDDVPLLLEDLIDEKYLDEVLSWGA